ncbi:MAG: hypothetical protein ACKOZT_06385 [Cyanobium sp.]
MPSLRLPARLGRVSATLAGSLASMVDGLPVPRTLAAALLLILLPALLLGRWSRPRAAGLEQLMGSASLLQSFAATPERPVPALWSQRLGAVPALRLWQAQRRVWWQLWANQTESAPFLVLEADRPGSLRVPLPPQALRVGDLLVVAEDAIARRQLEASLRPLQRRSSGGLPKRCLQRLEGGQAVYWNATALGVILGKVAPLFERFQAGCLSLALEQGALRWQGEAAAAAGVASRLPEPAEGRGAPAAEENAPSLVPPVAVLPPLPADELLELGGSSLGDLLGGLLDHAMIREPLASRYGLDGRRLDEARRTPFRMRLRPQPMGPFQASLELQLRVDKARGSWLQILDRVSASLLAQGFERVGAPAPASTSATPQAASAQPATQALPLLPAQPHAKASQASSAPPTDPAGSPAAPASQPAPDAPALWRRADGVVVGGWQWVQDGSRPPQLLLHLGPPPLVAAALPGSGLRPAAGQFWMRLRPQAMASLGLLPAEMPAVLQRATQVWIEAEPWAGRGQATPLTRLTGRLQLHR